MRRGGSLVCVCCQLKSVNVHYGVSASCSCTSALEQAQGHTLQGVQGVLANNEHTNSLSDVFEAPTVTALAARCATAANATGCRK